MNESFPDLVTYSLEVGQRVLAKRSPKQRKQTGQFFTPAPVARFMAQQLGTIRSGDRILDPAIGSGVLACAVIERLLLEERPLEIWLDGYEIDVELSRIARKTLKLATSRAAARNVIVHTQIYENDFVLSGVSAIQPYLFVAETTYSANPHSLYNHVIANPPYFKLNSSDPRVKAVAGQIKGHTNIYTLFLALAIRKLSAQGRGCFIVPRSFCSGAYFSSLRQHLVEEVLPVSVHLFESRRDAFRNDSVLQENIVFSFQRRQASSAQVPLSSFVNVSASNGTSTLNRKLLTRRIPLTKFLGKRYGSLFFRVPTGELDEQILEVVDDWTGSLNEYGLKVSTGPVVAFRARQFLTDVESVNCNKAVPLLWMQNVSQQQVVWPVSNGNKEQGISLDKGAQPLLVPVANYVLLRRFSTKEDPRRLIAAPLLAKEYQYPWIGLENHLNYIYKKQGKLDSELVFGLSALLNSALIDRYFRILNGNTQVNAAELRVLPLPPLNLIREIGRKLLAQSTLNSQVDFEAVVFNELRRAGYLPLEIPLLRETRITMGKIQEGQDVLKTLGLPPNQQNEISALTLLVLAQLSEETPWSEAKRQSLRIHDILIEIKERYGREYAENTRETIRRQVIHQFQQAGLVLRNPDDPTLATNSPRTHYALSDAAIRTIRSYEQPEKWKPAVQSFIESRGALLEMYQKAREQHKVPLRLASGEEYHLSPGQHNELQAAIVEEFGPRFAPGAKLLYLGDTEDKTLILDEGGFEDLGIPVPSHDKLPDVVFYDEEHNRLFLIEAVTSHGPVSPKRHLELEKALKGCLASRIYVSAFSDFTTFKSFVTEIAWETEVWLAEIPDHLIHFDGERFLNRYAD